MQFDSMRFSLGMAGQYARQEIDDCAVMKNRKDHFSISKFLLSRMRYRQIEGFRLNYFVKVTIPNCRHSMTRMITLF